MQRFFTSLVDQARSRATESTLGLLSITHPGLREHLSGVLAAESGNGGSFLAAPQFEPTFEWEPANCRLRELGTGPDPLLTPPVVDALDHCDNGRYRFNADWSPFSHQLRSWEALLREKKSIVVTSGTGSGKTECFMVPVIEDLHRELEAEGADRLEGVRALFLYPLNALIDSQRDRLDAWTRPFGEGMRYCLYNGRTPDRASSVRTEQARRPNEVLSRERMRESPAPILVTNGTMLEYMMIRKVDEPIMRRSRDRKSLRWIVLDEAHTYVGSQAAELALQLRRVMISFGVKPEDVRFVATSATIADMEGVENLRRFLSDLSGVPVEQVEVVGGRRVVPPLPASLGQSVTLDDLEAMPSESGSGDDVSRSRFEALSHSPVARAIRDFVVGHPSPVGLDEIRGRVSQTLGHSLSERDALRWLDLCTGTRPVASEPAFLNLRAHFFQKTLHGLWSCIDPDCPKKATTPLAADWPFGNVYTDQRWSCGCGAPVLELAFCDDCNEPHLLADTRNEHLKHWETRVEDEFSLQADSTDELEGDEPDVDTEPARNEPSVFCRPDYIGETYFEVHINPGTRSFVLGEGSIRLGVNDSEARCSRPQCEFPGYSGRSPFNRALTGGPFYVAQAVPTVLEYTQDFQPDGGALASGPQTLPGRGRRLITFTDSRQGAARMAVRMQQEAERNKLRGLVVEVLVAAQRDHAAQPRDPVTHESVEALRTAHQGLLAAGMEQAAAQMQEQIEQQEVALQGQGVDQARSFVRVSWREMVRVLAGKADIAGPICDFNMQYNPDLFGAADGPEKLAEMLLFREFMRRPKRQNSAETLGLAVVDYVGLDRVETMPEGWAEKRLELQDWRDFLKTALDFYVRASSGINANGDWFRWAGLYFKPKQFRSPDSKEASEPGLLKWPQIRGGNTAHRLVKLLILGAGMNPGDRADVDLINDWLCRTWRILTGPGGPLQSDQNRFSLPLDSFEFRLQNQFFVCPVTNKLLDTSFRGWTPYLPRNIEGLRFDEAERRRHRVESVAYPDLSVFDRAQLDHEAGLSHIRKQIGEDPAIRELRPRSLWLDLNDRAVEGGYYYRTAEHSAQQSSERLEEYVGKFKDGRVNVLNCSTTMELGVDIGGITAVVMNNVPPHPANYLQRAGRAGRSREARAIAYTVCKHNPHDLQVFANPSWPFRTAMPVPAVAFSSARLVQRQVQALLLGDFLTRTVGAQGVERTKLTAVWFYLGESGSAPCTDFIESLNGPEHEVDDGIVYVKRGTVLKHLLPEQLRNDARANIQKLQEDWCKNHSWLKGEWDRAERESVYRARLERELDRLCNEYLLRELAGRTFLPGYGFPTDVVNFNNFTLRDYSRQRRIQTGNSTGKEDNHSRYRGLPSRNLSIAIREYAPGAEVVLDGRVFTSAGVSLHWHRLEGGANESQRLESVWRCDVCGSVGHREGVVDWGNLVCENSTCGAPIRSQNIVSVLQPAGFVADSRVDPTNNVQSQKFVPAAPPWVFLNTEETQLPNPALGAMAFDANGKVFHHSAGLYGHGYALCMTCGRAESMQDVGVFPKGLSPDGMHYAPQPTREDRRDGQRVACPGSRSLQQHVRLGVVATTDVFELLLRHPLRGTYVDDTPEGRTVALTLAIALRFALAEILGVSPSEIGYATRPKRLGEEGSALVLQLFDTASGGAGFASAAGNVVMPVLRRMAEKLDCDHCETGCSQCLLDTQTRIDHHRMHRTRAQEWLGDVAHEFVDDCRRHDAGSSANTRAPAKPTAAGDAPSNEGGLAPSGESIEQEGTGLSRALPGWARDVNDQAANVVARIIAEELPEPVVGYEVQNSLEEVVGEFELAWPDHQIGVWAVEGRANPLPEALVGWQLFTLPEMEDSLDLLVNELRRAAGEASFTNI